MTGAAESRSDRRPCENGLSRKLVAAGPPQAERDGAGHWTVPCTCAISQGCESSHAIGTNRLDSHDLTILIRTSIHEFSGHQMSPFPDTPLKCPELAVREAFRLFTLEAFKQFLCRYVRAFLQPPKNISPNHFKRIFSSSPMPGLRRKTAMGGPHLAGPPQLGQLRQELIEALSSGPLR